MTACERQRLHVQRLRKALGGQADPEVKAASRVPTRKALEQEIAHLRNVFKALKACRDPKCSLCSACVWAIWETADRKPRKDLRV